MSHNKGPDGWQAPLPLQVIVHRLDPNLLARFDYFLMLYAKSQGTPVDTSKLEAAQAKFDAATAELDATVKDQP